MSNSRYSAQKVPSGSNSMKKCLRKLNTKRIRKTWVSDSWIKWDKYLNPKEFKNIYQNYYW